ncbi:MAG: type II/IV secretion system protein [Parcubacteria group bacterium]|nr:type II/IV secretion system protein [Parcubacteria group bacterium]
MDDLTQKREEQIKNLWQESKERMAEDIAEKHNLLYINLKKINIAPSALEVVPEEQAKQANLVVFEKIGNLIKVGVINPENKNSIRLIEQLKTQNFKVVVYVITEESLNWAWTFYRFIKPKLEKLTNFIDVSQTKLVEFSGLNQELLNYPTEEVTALVSLILKSAINIDASDIHIEPQEDTALIRFRVDGVLYEVAEIDKNKYHTILARLKLLSGLKLNITTSPQNGRFSIQDQNVIFDVRASSLPGPKGEFLVFRLLNPKRTAFGLKDLGLRDRDLKLLEGVLMSPNGMILITGPTGSGKTTTLYALVKSKISPGIKIITIEDPIEYRLLGINQTQVSKDYNFENGLKSILRQDPDVIMIGEMRDKDTVKTALQASLTGHLVFSTLHTNEASGTIARLVELGAERNIIPQSLKVIVAQRLVRRLCPYCKEEYEPTLEMKEKIIEAFSILSPKSGIKIPKTIERLYRARGCDKCHFLGYQSQIGIFETLPITPKITQEILRNHGEDDIRRTAIDEGMVPLFHDGLLKAIEGITSLEEVTRVAGDIDYISKNYRELFSQTLLRGVKITKEEEKSIISIIKEKKNWEEYLKDLSTDRQIAYLLAGAIKSRATDLHFEPEEKQFTIRIRIDGVLHEMTKFDFSEAPRIINSLKDISGLKTEETQKIQEGRFRVILPDKTYDIRLSILPSGYGESASLRILGSEIEILDLDKIGLLPTNKTIIKETLKDTVGLILASGPTSSGKTTTLFAMLKELNKPGVKIITVEDPIEYRLPGVNQTQINGEKGYTFANALRTLLRQNPNIFLIGEIRDKETAEMVWQASLTGHLVLSTIHANDSLEIIPRIKSLGISSADILKATRLIITQRLVRVLCTHCKQEMLAPPELNPYFEHALKMYPEYQKEFKKPYKIYTSQGCSHCNFTGYLGQIGIFELVPKEKLENLEKAQYPKLIDDAVIKVLLGITSWEEIKRVLGI